MGTSWEHIGKKGGRKKSLFHTIQKEKNYIIHECMLSIPMG